MLSLGSVHISESFNDAKDTNGTGNLCFTLGDVHIFRVFTMRGFNVYTLQERMPCGHVIIICHSIDGTWPGDIDRCVSGLSPDSPPGMVENHNGRRRACCQY